MSGFLQRSGMLLPLFVVAAAMAACSTTPTGPTSRTQGAPLGTISQEAPPVPPRDSVTPARALGATRFLAFGDSLTYGTLSSFDGAFVYDVPSQSYTVRLQSALNVYHSPQSFTVINLGEPGEWAQDGARRFANALQTHRPHAVLLLQGFNDLNNGQSVTRTADYLRQMLDVAELYKVPVVIATMFQTYPSTSPAGTFRENAADLIPSFNTEIRRIAAGRQNVTVLDLYASFGSNRALVGGDGVHPTEDGYSRMATAFLGAIENAFPVRGSFQ